MMPYIDYFECFVVFYVLFHFNITIYPIPTNTASFLS